jgi:hypothetical protein
MTATTTLKDNVLTDIKSYIDKYEARLEDLSSIFKEFPLMFVKSYSEECYTINTDLRKLKSIKEFVEDCDDDDEVINYIKELKERFTDNLLRSTLMESSTNPMVCLTSVWENESLQRMVRVFDNFSWKYRF